jgi:hypothetical protein
VEEAEAGAVAEVAVAGCDGCYAATWLRLQDRQRQSMRTPSVESRLRWGLILRLRNPAVFASLHLLPAAPSAAVVALTLILAECYWPCVEKPLQR